MTQATPGVRDWIRRRCQVVDKRLESTHYNLRFQNPIGLAAGFDKNARCISGLASLGFGHVEVGTITGQPQPGNPKPRLFRLPLDNALVNRMGFNNDGSHVIAARIAKFQSPNSRRDSDFAVVGVNIGKSRAVPLDKANSDYLLSFTRLWPFADYVTINVSSPNTPGLRELQAREPLEGLLREISDSNDQFAIQTGQPPRPLFLKIAPDIEDQQIDDIAELIVQFKLHGVVATNTTISRNGLKTNAAELAKIGDGGISGSPLTCRSRAVVKRLFKNLNGKAIIVGVGGIMTPQDAWQIILAGASLVQIYSGFVYNGPMFCADINSYLLKQIQRCNLPNIASAVGAEQDLMGRSASYNKNP
jgi:dihydroorotate dehydrogenase